MANATGPQPAVAVAYLSWQAHLDQLRYLVKSPTPAGRVGTPRDVTAAVASLASDAAGFITGERVTVNGGHTVT